ncbi:helix-turn-helix domain-containing protein [Halobacteriovorax sp. CON-3]|uniref:helix-turn-helix domain-containing protein n=1 Tax=Halobacteriovorax sp. CON-3 TaxID=3157710 RepID=UPI003715D675
MEGNIYNNFGSLIRDRRKSLKMNQSELAKKSSINRVTIARIENGEQKIFLDTTLKLIKALDLDLVDVIEKLMSISPEKEIEDKFKSSETQDLMMKILKLEREKKDKAKQGGLDAE